jgi:hypothetical protein
VRKPKRRSTEWRRRSSPGRPNDAKNMATALGILIDKAQVLTGSTTNRQESSFREDLERRAKELDELSRRRAERLQRT